MTLRKKTFLFTVALFTGLILVLYSISEIILMGSFLKLEEKNFIRDTERVLSVLSSDISNLNNEAWDWSCWDESYEFIESADMEYVKRNLHNDTFVQLGLNFMIFVDSSGHVVFSKGFDLRKKEEISLPESLAGHLYGESPLLINPDTKSSSTGMILLPENPLLFASGPILTSDRKGPPRGTLIMARYLDSAAVGRLSRITQLSLSAHRLDDPQLPDDLKKVDLFRQPPVHLRPAGTDYMEGYAVLKDVYGTPGLILKAITPREISKQGRDSIMYFVMLLISSGLVFTATILLLMEKVILSRLARLSASVSAIGTSGDFSSRLVIPGRDELSNLALEINGMLEALENSRKNLRKSERRYRNLVENSPDLIFSLNAWGEISSINYPGLNLIGFATAGEVSGKDFSAYIHPEDRDLVSAAFSGASAGPDNSIRGLNFRMVKKTGETIWVELNAKMLPGGDENFAGLGIIRDVTERRLMEDKLKYLSLYDHLTGLYNRTYFEQEMQRLGGGRLTRAGIIICDVDGLKLVNDTLGHDTGDMLLLAAANVLKGCFRDGDMVARIGGDEFAVLLPDSTASVVETAGYRIRQAIYRYNQLNPDLPLSISLGIAVSDSGEPVKPSELFKEADNNMYREKLHHSQSTRSSIVQTLMKALEARDFITEGHADRLQYLVEEMARAIGLYDQNVTDLRLLAKFHDIGKVGIPDRILFKPGPLTPDEVAEMQRHCEIGRRIAISSADLAPIADWILKHHEWWNGKGYPLGLKGEEIPLECRILAIADAYDAMTSNRPYRSALPPEEALAEIKRCAGTQFDPLLASMFMDMLIKRNTP